MSVPSGWFLEYTGYKKGMTAGLVIMAVGSLFFVPAALTRTYGLFLTGLFIQGAGMALLQTASNPYVTIIGPIESAAKRISIMGICNGVAGVLAPAILGFITLKGADEIVQKVSTMTPPQKSLELDALATRVIIPYILIMVSLLLLAVFLYLSSLPDIDAEEENAIADEGAASQDQYIPVPASASWSPCNISLYTGVEVIAGNTIISYGVFLNIPIATSKFFSSFTIFAMLVGYVIGIITIPKYAQQKDALVISAVMGINICMSGITDKRIHFSDVHRIAGTGKFPDVAFNMAAGNYRAGTFYKGWIVYDGNGYLRSGCNASALRKNCRYLHSEISLLDSDSDLSLCIFLCS